MNDMEKKERIEEILGLTQESEGIFGAICNTLEENHVMYYLHKVIPCKLMFCTPAKTESGKTCGDINIEVGIDHDKITLAANLFLVEKNAVPIVAMYLLQCNDGKAFARWNIEENGKLTIWYSYLVTKASEFNSESFMYYIMSIVDNVNTNFVKLSQLGVGNTTHADKKHFLNLFIEAQQLLMAGVEEKAAEYGYCHIPDPEEVEDKFASNHEGEEDDDDEEEDEELTSEQEEERLEQLYASLLNHIREKPGESETKLEDDETEDDETEDEETKDEETEDEEIEVNVPEDE